MIEHRALTHGRGITFLSLLLCVGVGVAYCYDALAAPSFGGRDTDILSNLLPVVHYRHSILEERSLPLHTGLWFGGRAQWQNPLWSFLYLPATLIWLIFGLGDGTKVVLCTHVVFVFIAGWYLCGLFFERKSLRCMGAILLAAPLAPALKAGHIENILAYPWILLGTRFLLDRRKSSLKRGCVGGVCLGVTALAGANYYVLYGAILYIILILFQPDRLRLIVGFGAGALVGLPHTVSVLHLIGVPRGIPAWSIPTYSESSLLAMANDLFLGADARQRWGYLALIGIGMIPVLAICVWDSLKALKARASRRNPVAFAPLLAFCVFVLLASGVAYRGHHLLDTFRVPARALVFAALSLLLFVLLSVTNWSKWRRVLLFWMMLLSVVHVGFVLSGIRPMGSRWWLDNSGAEDLATWLRERSAESVWLQMPDGDMLIHVALNLEGIGLPNAYYGDMGQKVVSFGEHCGFSFDYILLPAGNLPDNVRLESDVPAGQVEGPPEIDTENLRFLRNFTIEDDAWSLYQVDCLDDGIGIPYASPANLHGYTH